jgi:hypothetical protein
VRFFNQPHRLACGYSLVSSFLDAPLRYQLTKHRLALVDLAFTWYSHVQEFSPITEWPAAIQCHRPPAGAAADPADDEWYDLSEFSALPEDVLEIDDQHAAFLEGLGRKEGDEVERLVVLVEAASEKRWVARYTMSPAGAQPPPLAPPSRGPCESPPSLGNVYGLFTGGPRSTGHTALAPGPNLAPLAKF